jgi:hypothetical protein
MKITVHQDMVNIDSDNIAYANIKDMYTTGNGSGLQINEEHEIYCLEIQNTCDRIAQEIYNLQEILGED